MSQDAADAGADEGDLLGAVDVPVQILIAVFAKLTLYGLWCGEGRFAELLRILENDGATGLSGSAGALRSVGMGLAWERNYEREVGGGGLFFLACWAWYWLSQRWRRVTAARKS